ncbi:hypothetical protein [Afipia sp. GAS231]|uniref:hypothetical protein n=1 Tax=Afipia sp. GAS231 TaxID=1882747 RepID=UPI00087DB787|nr:hypothetical protein [Afipia sp. GAS231]SDP33242.1 hypothetical protein SAMN05444050_6505 [Afipia sp. GAS231]
MHARFLALAGALVVVACSASGIRSEDLANDIPTIEQLLSLVPENANWQDLPPDLQANFQKRASAILSVDRQSWGLSRLQQKADILFSAPTPAMTENIDRVLSITFASELPVGFAMSRDVTNADLKRMLIRLYVTITDDRGFMLQNHPEFKAWDGMPVKELQITDHEHFKSMTVWSQQTEDGLRKIPDQNLTSLETKLRAKSYFTTRAGKYFDKPAVGLSGEIGYSSLYALPAELRPFPSDTAFLEAHNASMFTEFREVNVGTLDAFEFDYESEFNRTWLAKQGMSDALTTNVLKLGSLYRTRTLVLPEKSKRCTIFSPVQRAAYWDAFTAGQISNADGSETMQSYAKLFEGSIAQRLVTTRQVGILTLERLFPDGSADLTAAQRAQVADKLRRETRPAKMMDTLLATLDEVTGTTAASKKVNDTIARQPTVGGGYSPGQTVRDADKAQLLDMWNKIRGFIKREYGGYRVDIAALIPAEPVIQPTGDSQFTVTGRVNLSLGTAWNLASLTSTIMHEIKHAIDQNSHAAVEGAAWDGAATSIERQVWPIFIEEAMAEQAALLPVARLKTEIDNVRFTATTDATLKIFLRESCASDEPDTIAFAEGIVRNYGYDDSDILRLRSRRAHRSSQYLQYDYGLAMYADLLSYLQNGVGSTPRVDAYLLQACGMPSPKKDQATTDDLKACIRDRKP